MNPVINISFNLDISDNAINVYSNNIIILPESIIYGRGILMYRDWMITGLHAHVLQS